MAAAGTRLMGVWQTGQTATCPESVLLLESKIVSLVLTVILVSRCRFMFFVFALRMR